MASTGWRCCLLTGPAVALSFDTTSRYLACAGDKQVLVFHNVTGYQATIVDLQQKKKKATNSAYKDRLQQQIEEAKYVQLLFFVIAVHKLRQGNIFTSVCQEFCPQWGGGCLPQCMLWYTPPLADIPPGQTPPLPSACWDRHGYCCGRYASYWNAFLFKVRSHWEKTNVKAKTFFIFYRHSMWIALGNHSKLIWQ